MDRELDLHLSCTFLATLSHSRIYFFGDQAQQNNYRTDTCCFTIPKADLIGGRVLCVLWYWYEWGTFFVPYRA